LDQEELDLREWQLRHPQRLLRFLRVLLRHPLRFLQVLLRHPLRFLQVLLHPLSIDWHK
jgi:hypothetical protein